MSRQPWLDEAEVEALTKRKRPSSQADELMKAGIPFNMVAGRPIVLLQSLSPMPQSAGHRPQVRRL